MSQVVTATIMSVEDATKPYEGPNGLIHFVQGMFADGSQWSTGVKPEYVETRKQAMKGLVGQTVEYEVEAKKDYQGRKQWKLLNWPGKPAGAFGGGRSGGSGGSPSGGSPQQPVETFQDKNEAIARNVALKEAINFHAKDGVEVTGHQVLHTADQFLGWLVGSPSNRTFGDNNHTVSNANAGPTQGRSAAPAAPTQGGLPF